MVLFNVLQNQPDECASDAIALQGFRHFSMRKVNFAVFDGIFDKSDLAVDVDFELALRFVVDEFGFAGHHPIL